MEAVIDVRGLSKRFGNKLAVNRLSFQVPRGAIFALLGDNGAGKTTTIRMLTGLLEPDAGLAFILGRHCWRSAAPLRPRSSRALSGPASRSRSRATARR